MPKSLLQRPVAMPAEFAPIVARMPTISTAIGRHGAEAHARRPTMTTDAPRIMPSTVNGSSGRPTVLAVVVGELVLVLVADPGRMPVIAATVNTAS